MSKRGKKEHDGGRGADVGSPPANRREKLGSTGKAGRPPPNQRQPVKRDATACLPVGLRRRRLPRLGLRDALMEATYRSSAASTRSYPLTTATWTVSMALYAPTKASTVRGAPQPWSYSSSLTIRPRPSSVSADHHHRHQSPRLGLPRRYASAVQGHSKPAGFYQCSPSHQLGQPGRCTRQPLPPSNMAVSYPASAEGQAPQCSEWQ